MDQNLKNIISDGKEDYATEKQKQAYLSLFHQPDLEYELKNQLLEVPLPDCGKWFQQPTNHMDTISFTIPINRRNIL